MRRILRWLLSTLRKILQLPDWLNWLLSVIEPLVVLAIAFVILYIGYCTVFRPASQQQAWFKELLEEFNNNWKAGVLILIVLFYRTVRTFLEQAEEAFTVKRKTPLRGIPEEGSKPPSQEKS